MKVAVRCNDLQREICIQKGFGQADFLFITAADTVTDYTAFIDFQYSSGSDYSFLPAGVMLLVHSLAATCALLPAGAIRINAWPGFLERPVMELAVPNEAQATKLAMLMNVLGWAYQLAPDIPGMVTGRVLATIINEAYFALEEGVSTRTEIDTAMKLGTNYPYGPFEWAERIGHSEILAVLMAMSVKDSRYRPALLLQKEVEN